MARTRTGIWLIGARGGVATTATLGLACLQQKLCTTAGLVSELPKFSGIGFTPWTDFVIGGHEIRSTSLAAEAQQLHDVSRVFQPHWLEACRPALAEIDERIRPGILNNVGATITSLADPEIQQKKLTAAEAISQVQSDIRAFAQQEQLSRVVVLNVASTEPPCDISTLPATWAELEPQLEKEVCVLPASSLYAIAALDAGYPFVNFTPSLGSSPAAIDDLAKLRNNCHMGHDGKTGETLMKSVLAPMFAARNLPVMSWVGHNIFGNMDGLVLNDPANKKTKVVSKDKLLGQILGYDPQTLVSIEYIKSLGDWKTAWDHIHFQGFLGTQMTLQFTWQGCDSLLAAPLVLDLIRFTDLASRRSETGLLTFLASFFKSPLGVRENDFVRQFQMLEAWAHGGAI